MNPLATLPRRTWLERSSLGLGIAQGMIGGLSLGSWVLRVDELLQPVALIPPLRANAVKFTPSGSISVEVRRVTREPTPLGFEPGLPVDSSRIILEFSVEDTGIGIPDDRTDRLFRAFSQIDSSTTRKYGGTGLGLAICQRLAQLMGGSIRAESKPGQGSSFIFTIQTEAAPEAAEAGLPTLPAAVLSGVVLCVENHPLTQARLRTFFETAGARCEMASDVAGAQEAVARLLQPPVLLVVEGGELDGPSAIEALANLKCPRLMLYPFGQTAPNGPADGLPSASTSKPIRTSALVQVITALFNPKASSLAAAAKPVDRPSGEEIPLEVLLAEDNAVNQKVAVRILERLGYRADAVANGLEAVSTLERRHYDLVLMDLQMPEMDGFEATRQIRARQPANRQPKIIALTANAMQGDRELCVAAGMDDHISKPVKMHEIAATIRNISGKTRPSPRGSSSSVETGPASPVACARLGPRRMRGDSIPPGHNLPRPPGIAREVFRFSRIVLQVEKEPWRTVRVEHKFARRHAPAVPHPIALMRQRHHARHRNARPAHQGHFERRSIGPRPCHLRQISQRHRGGARRRRRCGPHQQGNTHRLFIRPAFAKQPVSAVHIAMHAGHHHVRRFAPAPCRRTVDVGQEPADGAVRRLDVRIIPREFPARPCLHFAAPRYIGQQDDLP